MASPSRKILVVGATGQQGSAVLAELAHLASTSTSPSSSFPKLKILALTRDASAKKSVALVPTYGKILDIEVVEGNTTEPGPIFAAHKGIDVVFAYTTPPVDGEENQAKALITTAAKSGVKHFVFSSVERGGDVKSWQNPTDVPHFVTKHIIELHLRKTCTEHPTMTYTILRPVAFMDNLSPTSGFGPVMAAMWATLPATTTLQMVSVRDIGVFGAQAVLHPENKRFKNHAIGLAGDELTLLDARAIYRKVAGLQLPQAWTLVGHAARWMSKDLGRMFNFFDKTGYGVDIRALRAQEPRLQNFETWLRESSTFECGKGTGKK
ncbi:hypothetical protein F4777DRAFT_380783 [Nemania sp. FL0916]|nr:hypothetical protein F4777DRAFT_380783 [Nemania sp. FL0916]